jgi:Bacterial Ig-like domain (group 3)/FG-GAP repeat
VKTLALQPVLRGSISIPLAVVALSATVGLESTEHAASAATWVQQSEISVSDGGTGDHLSTSVALSADGSTAVVGAPGHRVRRARAAGAAYVFRLSAGSWTQEAELEAPRALAGDSFATSVAVSSNGTTAIVGAPGRKGGAGAAFVFTEPRGGWSDGARGTTVVSGSPGDKLGEDVSVSGDGSTVAVGAPGRGAGAGALLVLVRPPRGWGKGPVGASVLTATDVLAGDHLGYSVAVSADGSTVGGGARDHLDGAQGVSHAGAAFVFTRPAAGWSGENQTAELVARAAGSGDELGTSVALSADGGVLVTGLPGHGAGDGSLAVFQRPSGGWATGTEEADLTATDARGGDLLGMSVAVSADGGTVVAGSPLHRGAGRRGGDALVFSRPSGGWSSETASSELAASDGGPLDWFGRSLSVTGDGRTSLVGSPLHAVGGLGAGAAYLLTSSVRTLTSVVASDPEPRAGRSVTYTAQVFPRPSGGAVTFTDGSSPVTGCADKPVDPITGRAVCNVAYLLAGTHSIAATYSGDADDAPSDMPQSLRIRVEGVMGYSLTAADGSVASFGRVRTSSPLGTVAVNAPVVGAARVPGASGGWLFTDLGGVFSYGGAVSYGSLGSVVPAAAIVGGTATPDGHGYSLFGADGGVMSFGDAPFYGSLQSIGTVPLAPIVGGARTADGRGYWLFGSNGAVFPFGDALFLGSAYRSHLKSPVVSGAVTPDGRGYWLFTAKGQMFHFGDATSYGTLAQVRLRAPITSAAASTDGKGYWMFGADGSVFSFGDAGFDGSLGTVGLAAHARIVAGVPS